MARAWRTEALAVRSGREKREAGEKKQCVGRGGCVWCACKDHCWGTGDGNPGWERGDWDCQMLPRCPTYLGEGLFSWCKSHCRCRLWCGSVSRGGPPCRGADGALRELASEASPL